MSRFFKTAALLVLSAALTLGTSGTTQAASMRPSVQIDGQKLTFDLQPYIKKGRVMAPIRGIFEALGASVYFDPKKLMVVATKGDTIITLRVGFTQATVNGRVVELDARPEFGSDRVTVPVRFVSEALGAVVDYDNNTRTVLIQSGKRPIEGLKSKQALNFPLEAEPRLDPIRAGNLETDTMLTQMYEGLVRIDENGKIVPGIAEKWEASTNGRTYTFTLRPDAKWSDGSQVTAHDFEYAWKRSLDPKSKAHPQKLLFIKGATEYALGGKWEDVQIKVLDDLHLQVTIQIPYHDFLRMVATPGYFPLKGEPDATDPTKTITNGPFKVSAYVPGQLLSMSKNDQYWDQSSVRLQAVNFFPFTVNVPTVNLYNAGALSRVVLRPTEIQANKKQADYRELPMNTTSYLLFNEKVAVLQNANVRKALTYAIDVDPILEQVTFNGEEATGLVPSGMSDGNGTDFRTTGGDLIKRAENAPKAKELLQQGLKEAGVETFPKLTLLVDSTEEKMAGIIQQQWKEKLGVEVTVQALPLQDRLRKTSGKDYEIALSFYAAEYNDPVNFLGLYKSNFAYNDVGYSNSKYDTPVRASVFERDLKKRAQELYDAEKILMEDMPVGPILFREVSILQQPNIKGLVNLNSVAPYYDAKLAYNDRVQ